MCGKLMYLISVALVLGLVSNATGRYGDYKFEDGGADHLWTNPNNWNPNADWPPGPPNAIDDGANFDKTGTKCEITDGMDALCRGFMIASGPVVNEAEISGGTLTCQWIDVGRGRKLGTRGYLKITGGVITVNSAFKIPNQFDLREPELEMIHGHVDLHGGVINAGSFAMGDRSLNSGGGVGTMDVTEGTLIVSGDQTADIQGWINRGWITAWGGTGRFLLDYDIKNPGRTTLAARPPVMVKPYLLYPENNAEDVQPGVVLSWSAGAYVQDRNGHDVYIGTTFDEVSSASRTSHPNVEYYNVDATTYGPLSLEFSRTYYWRVDEFNDAHPEKLWSSGVGRFTVGDNALVDDMEYYGWENQIGIYGSRIWYTWKDGEGWTSPAPGWGGNGTGAVVDLEQGSGNVHTGEQSLKVDYDNDGVNVFGIPGKAYYSEIKADIADLPIGPAWAAYGSKALELWFHGTAGNDATQQMWVALEDAIGVSAMVPYNGNMSDIAIDEWKLWRIPLKEFTDVNLDDIKSIAIGFGLRGNTTTRGGAGTVYFDDIRVYPCRPGSLATDLNKDCVVDFRDLAIFMDSWLSKKLTP